MSAIRFEGVSKRFGDSVAVRMLDLEIERGEFFSLLGPSGCGKTTTLRTVAGFEQPSERASSSRASRSRRCRPTGAT